MCRQDQGKLTTECGVFTVRTPDYFERRPFHLGMLGLKSTGISTGCRDGFVASYAMWGGRLFLAELSVLTERQDLPDICGIYPESTERSDPTYRGLRLPLGYSGILWVQLDEEFTVWIPIREKTQIHYRLVFHGGLLREVEKVIYNPQAHYLAAMHPRDQPIDQLPSPDTATLFDNQIIPMTDWERERIDREELLEHKRRLGRKPGER